MLMSKNKRVRSPRSFGEEEGAVGLRIVIGSGPVSGRVPRLARSDPIPIRSRVVGPTAEGRREEEDEDDEVELSESYTCVTSHVGGRAVRKRVYVDDGTGGKYGRSSGVFFESPPEFGVVGPTDPGVSILGRCGLCGKKLHGLDIFMYGGDKALCTVECRCKPNLSDEHKEKCRSDEAVEPCDYSVSPYPSSLLFATGVAAA